MTADVAENEIKNDIFKVERETHAKSNDILMSTNDMLISNSNNKDLKDYALLDSVNVEDCDCNEVELSTSLENDALISNSPDNESNSMLEDNLTIDQQLLLLTQLIDRHESENPLDPENSQSFFVNPEDENHLV